MRASPDEYAALELRAHSLLADVPLHDVWALDLAGGGPGVTLSDLRPLLSLQELAETNLVVRLLFRLRAWLGARFGWDREPSRDPEAGFAGRLSAEERERSLVAPGTPEGPFRVVYASAHESISEIRNATVHAFSVFALREGPEGYRFYWAIYVRPVGRITGWYMALIDPFRRFIIYPAVLRRVRSVWQRDLAGAHGASRQTTEVVAAPSETPVERKPAVSVSIDRDSLPGVTIAAARGSLALQDIRDATAEVWRRVSGPSARILFDLREARFDLTPDEIPELAEFVKQGSPYEDLRTAFVVAKDLEYGLLRMFEAFRETQGTDTSVFRDREEGLAWLTREDP